MNILFAWELGLGLGHVWRHRDLAILLQQRGHTVSFAVKDLHLAATALAGPGFQTTQAPHSPRSALPGQTICSHADILAHHGMADPEACSSLLEAWSQCYQSGAIDLVVVDHAPGALFAAKCLGIKTLELATGFYMPPPVTPFPSFRPWEGLSETELLRRESQCLAAMNPFALACGKPAFSNLASALAADVGLLASFAELDHYPQRKTGRYIGPTESYRHGELASWPGRHQQRVFVYLRHVGECAQLLEELRTLPVDIVAYCPDLAASERQALAAANLTLVDRPVQIAPILERCDLAVTTGGHGVVSACVLAGVPVLAIPLHMEQRLMADCIQRCGMGDALMQPGIAARFKASAQRLLSEPGFRAAARRLQHKYGSYSLPKTLERLANTAEGLVTAAR